MIADTLDQAAQRVGTPVETLTSWAVSGHLVTVLHPVDGQRYVREDHLVAVERAQRLGVAEVLVEPPLPLEDLVGWLWERARIHVTVRALKDWRADGDLRRVDDGGQRQRALYDPRQALAVWHARHLRLRTWSRKS